MENNIKTQAEFEAEDCFGLVSPHDSIDDKCCKRLWLEVILQAKEDLYSNDPLEKRSAEAFFEDSNGLFGALNKMMFDSSDLTDGEMKRKIYNDDRSYSRKRIHNKNK